MLEKNWPDNEGEQASESFKKSATLVQNSTFWAFLSLDIFLSLMSIADFFAYSSFSTDMGDKSKSLLSIWRFLSLQALPNIAIYCKNCVFCAFLLLRCFSEIVPTKRRIYRNATFDATFLDEFCDRLVHVLVYLQSALRYIIKKQSESQSDQKMALSSHPASINRKNAAGIRANMTVNE